LPAAACASVRGMVIERRSLMIVLTIVSMTWLGDDQLVGLSPRNSATPGIKLLPHVAGPREPHLCSPPRGIDLPGAGMLVGSKAGAGDVGADRPRIAWGRAGDQHGDDERPVVQAGPVEAKGRGSVGV